MQRILRLRHYAGSTERSYLGWCRRFLLYLGRSGEHEPTGDDVQAFLSHLAVQGKVSAATQNQAFHAVLFMLRHVLVVEAGNLSGTVRARQGHKLPVVLLPEETRAVLGQLKGTHRLMLELVYGAGLRLGELLKLRVKDLDFEAYTVTVRASKGDKDRVTFLPKRLALAPEMEGVSILVAGVGSTWQDNDLHHQLECASVIVAPHGGDWQRARERIGYAGTEVCDPRARAALDACGEFEMGLADNRFVRRDYERMRQAMWAYIHAMGTSQMIHRDLAREGEGLSALLDLQRPKVPDRVPFQVEEMLGALRNNQWKRRQAEIEDCM